MNIEQVFITSFLFGFLGSLHCVSMCGGIINFLFLYSQEFGMRIFFYQLIYNFARIFSYGVIGVIVGFLGIFIADLFNFNIKFFYNLISSSMFFFLGWYLIGANSFFSKKIYHDLFNFFFKKMNFIYLVKSPFKEIALGLLWGNFPCGFIYGALSMSFVSGSILNSFFVMFFFGLGTIPAILFTQIFYFKIKNMAKIFKKIIGIFLLIYSILLLLKFIFNPSCHVIVNHFLFL